MMRDDDDDEKKRIVTAIYPPCMDSRPAKSPESTLHKKSLALLDYGVLQRLHSLDR
jgi:hypothetical protein